MPRGDVLGTFDSYPDAQAVVAKLAESDFPVNKLSIVGNELKTVERVTGKMTYGRAALAGALSGLWLGFFFGIVLTLFSPTASGLIFAAALIGAAFGVLYGVVSFAITKRQRDFTSVHQVLATNYQIIVDPQLVGQAQRILGQFGATPHAAWNPGQSSGAPFQGRPPQQQAPQQQQQPPQQQWRPGPDQGSPYGGHATPHNQPGGSSQAGPSAPAPGSQPQAQPRYGTNDGPRYGEVTQPGQRPQQPAAPSAAPAPRADEPPRYGERVPGATPPAASDEAPERRQDDDQPRGDDRR
ncbi:hypothetical protein BIU98_13970 [Curtobacterium sp. MMLR14_010]|nr:hypothetical protein BIU98_13970 [Curtobacterium sp. MMLR14_010]